MDDDLDDYKLDTTFEPDHVSHVTYKAERARGYRKVKVEHRWFAKTELGAGSFGTVRLESTDDGQQRAVKAVRKAVAKRYGIDYRRELSALTIFSRAKFAQHEVFVEFLGWFENSDYIFLAMEYLPLGDLSNFSDDDVPESDVKDICLQLLEGLEIMHEKGFTHRDLKPQNIFVVKIKPWWVKIGDFGIAKRVRPDNTTQLRTTTGTQGYEAPEIRGYISSSLDDEDSDDDAHVYTNAVDIWSLGCIMYELVAHQLPFPTLRTLKKFCDGRSPFPNGLQSSDLHPTGIDFIESLLEKKPLLRPAASAALEASWFSIRNENGANELTGTFSSTKSKRYSRALPIIRDGDQAADQKTITSRDVQNSFTIYGGEVTSMEQEEDKNLSGNLDGYEALDTEKPVDALSDIHETRKISPEPFALLEDPQVMQYDPIEASNLSMRSTTQYQPQTVVRKPVAHDIPHSNVTTTWLPQTSTVANGPAEEVEYATPAPERPISTPVSYSEEPTTIFLPYVPPETITASPSPPPSSEIRQSRTPEAKPKKSKKYQMGSWFNALRLPKNRNFSVADTVSAVFGVPLSQSIMYANVAISLIDDEGNSYIYGYVPIVVAKIGVYLKEEATNTPNIFIVRGEEKRIRELKVVFNSPDRYGKGLVWNGYTIHDAASTLLDWLVQLPEPVVSLHMYDNFRAPLRGDLDAADFDMVGTIRKFQEMVTEMPPLNRQLLLYLLDLLAVFASKSDENRMTSSKLAAVFQPGILSHPAHPQDPLDPVVCQDDVDFPDKEIRLSQRVLVFLIENQDHFLIGMRGTAADE